jgi:hypothetical protein
MIPLLRKANPNIRIALISAIAYENIPASPNSPTDATLKRSDASPGQTATRFGTGTEFIDLFSGYAQKMEWEKSSIPICPQRRRHSSERHRANDHGQ